MVSFLNAEASISASLLIGTFATPVDYEGRATLAVKGDAPGSRWQSFEV